METLKIKYNPEFKDKLFATLNSFKPNEVQIVEKSNDDYDDEAFINHRNQLQLTLKRIDSGESKMYSLEELDALLEETISKYEN